MGQNYWNILTFVFMFLGSNASLIASFEADTPLRKSSDSTRHHLVPTTDHKLLKPESPIDDQEKVVIKDLQALNLNPYPLHLTSFRAHQDYLLRSITSAKLYHLS